jgi:hypothetical protein
MDGCICANCKAWLTAASESCPECNTSLVWDGENRNIIDRIEPNCLVHRYDGSDLLEPGVVIKVGKSNLKVATRLKEFSSPITVSKTKVFSFNQNLLSSIQALRNERTATMMRFDRLIQSHWQDLKPFHS